MRIVEKANAKINLTLNIVSKRENGYHNLKMIMTPISLYDELFIEDSEVNKVVCNVEGLTGTDNIVYKTIKKLQNLYDIEKNVKIEIIKQIPIGAGLGGGSADCAATLRGLNELWNLGLSLDELAEIGLTLGADVPFCIYNRQAVVSGIGENIEFIDDIFGYVVLVIPKIGVSTKEIFSNTNSLIFTEKNIDKQLEYIIGNNIQALKKILFNDLEKVTLGLNNELQEISGDIKHIDKYFIMTGSGSVFYSIYETERESNQIVEALKKEGFNILKSSIVCNRLQCLL
ncbi:4-(cytidine 5'-diphospho)-2-C-methyl-D-erythritol kinase [Mycoplasmatota bacterium WC44]